MAKKDVYDRVRETTTTTGTGTITLANSAPTGYVTFGSRLADEDTCYYVIEHQTQNEWEVGYGTYDTTGPTLARTEVLASSNSDAAVNFSAGAKNVWIDLPARLLSPDMLVRTKRPVFADWAWINQGTATASVVDGGIYITDVAAASAFGAHILKKSIPANYAIFGFIPLAAHTEYSFTFVGHRESATGKLVVANFSPHSGAAGDVFLRRTAYTNATTWFGFASVSGFQTMTKPQKYWIKAAYDGTDIKMYWSNDRLHWMLVWTQAKASFFTTAPDEVCFGVDPYSQDAGIWLFDYEEG